MITMLFPYFLLLYTFVTYHFLFAILKLQISGISKKRILCYIMITILMLIASFIIFEYFPYNNGYATVQHLPGIYEYILIIVCLIILFGNKQKPMALFYCVLGYTFIIIIDVITDFILTFWINWATYELLYFLLKITILIAFYLLIKIVHKNLGTVIYEKKDWRIFSLLAIIFCIYIYISDYYIPYWDYLDGGASLVRLESFQILSFVVIYIIFFGYLNLLGKRNQTLQKTKLELNMKLQQERLLSDLNAANQENRNFRHDIKHHFYVLENMIATEPNKAIEYLSALNKQIEVVKVIESGNPTLDYILNSKAAICKQHGIDFTYIIQDSLKQIKDFDLISLLSNALDNAIEASQYVDKKIITIEINNKRISNEIIIENNCDPSLLNVKNHHYETIKKDKNEHGIGMERMKTIVNEYHGVMDVTVSSDLFRVSIFLPK